MHIIRRTVEGALSADESLARPLLTVNSWRMFSHWCHAGMQILTFNSTPAAPVCHIKSKVGLSLSGTSSAAVYLNAKVHLLHTRGTLMVNWVGVELFRWTAKLKRSQGESIKYHLLQNILTQICNNTLIRDDPRYRVSRRTGRWNGCNYSREQRLLTLQIE